MLQAGGDVPEMATAASDWSGLDLRDMQTVGVARRDVCGRKSTGSSDTGPIMLVGPGSRGSGRLRALWQSGPLHRHGEGSPRDG
jgi:hypothetical protein